MSRPRARRFRRSRWGREGPTVGARRRRARRRETRSAIFFGDFIGLDEGGRDTRPVALMAFRVTFEHRGIALSLAPVWYARAGAAVRGAKVFDDFIGLAFQRGIGAPRGQASQTAMPRNVGRRLFFLMAS